MERFAQKYLLAWVRVSRRKPLILRGARQVGKTWLVRWLADEAFESFVEVDLEKRPDLHACFGNDLDPRAITSLLEVGVGARIVPGKTRLFLDEVMGGAPVRSLATSVVLDPFALGATGGETLSGPTPSLPRSSTVHVQAVMLGSGQGAAVGRASPTAATMLAAGHWTASRVPPRAGRPPWRGRASVAHGNSWCTGMAHRHAVCSSYDAPTAASGPSIARSAWGVRLTGLTPSARGQKTAQRSAIAL